MIEFIVAQAPPTPTLMAVPTAPMSIPSDLYLWETTDEVVQLWQSNSGATTGIQYLVIAAIIAAALFMLIYHLNKMRDGSDK